MNLLQKIRSWFNRKKLDAEMSEEMRLHLERRVEENVASGMSPEEARYAALRTFGGVEQAKEIARARRPLVWLEHLGQDARYAMRALCKAPGFTGAVVLTLALGIGLVTAIVNIAQPILLPDLPFRDPERLVFLRERSPFFGILGTGYSTPTVPRFMTYAERSASFTGWGVERREVMNLVLNGEPQAVFVSVISGDLFSTLGATALEGRVFARNEYEPATAGESVVLTHGAWVKYFGRDVGLVGRDILLGERQRRVIGILPPRFRSEYLFEKSDGIFVTVPLVQPGSSAARNFVANVVGRVKPGVTVAQAEAELTVVMPEVARESRLYGKIKPWLVSVPDAFRQNRATPFRILLGAAASLLLIGCTAVANLMLSRATARRRELAVRLALGGSRKRIMALVLTEAAVLGLACGAGGALVATWAQKLMTVLAPSGMTADDLLQHVVFGRTFGFAVGLALVTCILSSLLPAWRAGRVGLNEALKEGSGSLGDSRRLSFVRGLFVVVQSALAVTLLSGTGLLIQTVHRLGVIDLGFVAENKLVLNGSRRGAMPEAAAEAINTAIAARVAALPEVAGAVLTSSVPVAGSVAIGAIKTEGPNGLLDVSCYMFRVPANYFDVLEMRFVEGTGFAQLHPGDRPVAIINEGMARQLFGSKSAIGQTVILGTKQLEILGVVRDVVMGAPGTAPITAAQKPVTAQLYEPSWQSSIPLPFFNLVVRLRHSARAEFAATVRRAIFEIDPSLALNIQTLDEVIGGWSRQQRQTLLILQILSALALAFAAFGVFSVMAYSVVQRRRELGMRLVLGATPRGLMAFVLKGGLKLGALGVGVGVLAAAALSRFLSAILYQTNIYDPLVYALVAALLLLATLAACWLPARWAAKVDPMVALRAE